MARPSVIPAVRERLELYLEELETTYLSQPDGNRVATIPATPDGKVNVTAVAKAIGLTKGQVKYLHEHPELYNLVNLFAEGQYLNPIGARLLQEAGDKVLKARMVRQAQSANASAQAAVEAQAATGELLEKLKDAVVEIESLKAENMRLKAQLDQIHSGLLVRVVD